jgi:hypothetical protein
VHDKIEFILRIVVIPNNYFSCNQKGELFDRSFECRTNNRKSKISEVLENKNIEIKEIWYADAQITRQK